MKQDLVKNLAHILDVILKADANKTYDTPMNGKIEGTDLYDVIDKTKAAAESQ